MSTYPTPQRQLRGHMPSRPTSRLASTGEHQAWLARRLTARDRWLARMLYEHRVLTTHQIAELAWPTVRAANHRLLDLYGWRVIDRFQPFVTTGSAPMHYVLDVAGAVQLAHEDGLDPKSLGYRHQAALGIAHSLQLAHTVGTNGFFTSLVAGSCGPMRGLTTWWSERRCATYFGDVVRPDGYGRWTEAGAVLEFFLEHDCGTETLDRLTDKVRRYAGLATRTGISTPVLFNFPGSRREANARQAFAALADVASVPVITTNAKFPSSVAAQRWLPVVSTRSGRLRIGELALLWPCQASETAADSSTRLSPPAPLPPESPGLS